MPFNIRSTASPLTGSYAQQAGGFADMAIRQRLMERDRVLAAIREFAASQAAKRAQRQAERGGGGPLGTGAGMGTGALVGGLVGGPPGALIGAGIGGAAGGAVGELASPAGSPQAAARDERISTGISSLAPLFAGGGAALAAPSGQRGAAFRDTFGMSMDWDFMPPPGSGAGGPSGGLGKPPSGGGYSSYGGVNRPSSLGLVPMA